MGRRRRWRRGRGWRRRCRKQAGRPDGLGRLQQRLAARKPVQPAIDQLGHAGNVVGVGLGIDIGRLPEGCRRLGGIERLFQQLRLVDQGLADQGGIARIIGAAGDHDEAAADIFVAVARLGVTEIAAVAVDGLGDRCRPLGDQGLRLGQGRNARGEDLDQGRGLIIQAFDQGLESGALIGQLRHEVADAQRGVELGHGQDAVQCRRIVRGARRQDRRGQDFQPVGGDNGHARDPMDRADGYWDRSCSGRRRCLARRRPR